MKNTFDLQNPWRIPGYNFPREDYIQRGVFDKLLKDLGRKEITVVVGSRQVGKTFLMKKLIEKLLTEGNVDPSQIFYFNFDAFNCQRCQHCSSGASQALAGGGEL